MKSRLRKTISVVLCLTMVIVSIPSVLAVNSVELSSSDVDLSNMSTTELNALIDAIAEGNIANSRAVTDPVQLAWLAAAQIARNAGYPLAATMVEHSVNNTDYSEVFGAFTEEILTTNVYASYLQKLKWGIEPSSLAFERSSGMDLFCALHLVSIEGTATTVSDLTTYWIEITDVFDFEFDNQGYEEIIGTINNWAWLCENAGVLNPISISITFIDD